MKPTNERILEKTGSIFFGIYVVGFLTWNFYLGHFGFFEYDLLQTRFISAGLLVLLPFLILWASALLLQLRQARFAWTLLIGILLSLINAIYWFPSVGQYFGGARPQIVSLIVSSSLSEELHPLGIAFASAVETTKVCKIYENRDTLLIGFTDVRFSADASSTVSIHPNRLLVLKTSNVDAISVLPQENRYQDAGLSYNLLCRPFRETYGIRDTPKN